MSSPGDVSTTAVETALDRVLSSDILRSSVNLRRFLAYVVRHAIAGDEERVKEYTIGVEVFSRGARFDPRCDSIVRVEAHKLRERLNEYYRTEGATDIVAISIPKGRYRPTFEVRARLTEAILDDPENLCCQAESLVFQGTPAAIVRARRHLRAAVARWPTRADLRVALASATLAALDAELIAPAEGLPLLRSEARQARRLDATRSDVQFYETVAEVRHPNISRAVAAARGALAFAPQSPSAHFWMARMLAADGRLQDARMHLELAVKLRPSSLFFQTWRAVALFRAGEAVPAARHLRDILAFEPRDYLANYWLSVVAALCRRFDEARSAAQHAHDTSGVSQALAGLGFVEASAGHKQKAERILHVLGATNRTQYVARSELAIIHVALGYLNIAATQLRLAAAEGDWQLAWAGSDPRWRSVRDKLATC
jgi:tetratricopeptide (TPR) repeat protein